MKAARWHRPSFPQPCLAWLWILLPWLTVPGSLLSAQSVPDLLRAHSAAERRAQSARQEEWFLRGRNGAGESSAALRYRAYRQKLHLRQLRKQLSKGSDNLPANPWAPLGPAPLWSDASGDNQENYNWVSGRATAVAADPADPTGNTVYVGGAYGGLWKSTNAGPLTEGHPENVVWTPLIDDQATLAVGAIAIQPGGTGVVLAGTGEANSSTDSYYGLGILRSADAGNTWTLISSDSTGTRPFAGMGFSRIAFSAASSSLAVASTAATSEGITEGLENPITANLGLYASTDGGNTWNYANVTDSGVAVSPGSATSVVYNAAAGVFYAALRYHGFYASTDGVNWSRLANQPGSGLTTTACPPQTVSPSLCPIYRGEIAALADPAHPSRNELYVWYVDANDNDQGIWVSADGGNTWNQLDETGIISCGDQLGCGTEQGAYNLALAAVADGTTTDLYAGAVNLYKCTVTGVPLQCFSPFLNLTHVYGCPPDFGSIAHVHPAQHAIASLINANTQDVMYFANDGGIYRALNAYTGLTSGTCGTPNAFDSLNQTLGSMTQLVSVAQAASDPNVLLAGSQGNGAAATALAMIPDNPWQSVNYGDNGYSLISPANDELWFVSNPPESISGVNIFSCANGINCDFQDFQNDQLVSSATVGGDTGPYYPPFIFDPSGPSQMIVGTCRVWRGPSAGGTYTVLSHSFETGGDGICTGSETNLVRSLAAAVDFNGFTAMYAGTDGFGPLIPTTPPGGHVWVSPNIANGPSSWVDQTGSINPNNFPISGIALDTSDTSANTAYVTIMGFHVSHVWQTTDGGASWTDFTANLPDAPAHAVLVDPGTTPTTGTVYVGTDVGVFYTSTAAPSWTEVGVAGGYLPNVPVTALAMYTDSSDKLLRASTYGRGVWQFPIVTTPYYVLTVKPNTMTVFGGQPAVFQGKAIALNGYAGTVTLSCSGTNPPPTCSFSPNPVTASNSGADFTLTASGADGDYSFKVNGIDSNNLQYNFPLTLHVVDFALTAPSPSSITVNEPATSPPVKFQVKAFGKFNATVDLFCSGLPSDATCSFQPSNSVNPTSSNPVNVTLTITTTSQTPTGTFPVKITGSTSGGPDETQDLSLTVTNLAGYALFIADPNPQAVPVMAVAVFKGTLTSSNGYSSPVDLTCAAGSTAPPASCIFTPSSAITPTTSGAPFTASVKSDFVQAFNFKIWATGTDSSKIQQPVGVSFSTTFWFQLSSTPTSAEIAAGQTATYDLDLSPEGSTFPQAVSLSCSGLPAESTCNFTPSQVTAGSPETYPALKITTTAASLSRNEPSGTRHLLFYAAWLPLAGVLLAWPGRRKRVRAMAAKAALIAIVLAVAIELACSGVSSGGGGGGGSGNGGTPPNTYQINVIATIGSHVNTPPLQVTLKVD